VDLDDGLVIPRLIQIDGERSFEESVALRSSMYARIREHIPLKEVIDAVESCQPRTTVTWTDESGQPVDLNSVPDGYPVCAVVHARKLDRKELISEVSRLAAKVKASSEPLYPTTAGELLAHSLRLHLAALRAAERKLRRGESSVPPVRESKMLPRSVIAEAADDLLEDCGTWGYPPGPELSALIRELLGVDRTRKQADREYKAKYEAAWILAQAEVGVRKLAGMVGVKPSTVSTWKRDQAFIEQIEHNKRLLDRRRRGESGFTLPPE
jgi:hypothetical protein